MRIITNEGLIKRNARIGQITSLVGLVILIGGMVLSFQNTDQFALSLAALLIGFALSQIGIYYGNRYARLPRPDMVLNAALKGLDRSFTLYHYTAPATHLLIGPAGIWVLVPRNQRGRITYENGKYRQRGGMGLTYMRIFAQEGLGRPDLEIGSEANAVKKLLEKEIPGKSFPEIQGAILFYNEKAEVAVEDAPIPTMPISYIKDFIRKAAKTKGAKLNPEQIELIIETLEGE